MWELSHLLFKEALWIKSLLGVVTSAGPHSWNRFPVKLKHEIPRLKLDKKSHICVLGPLMLWRTAPSSTCLSLTYSDTGLGCLCFADYQLKPLNLFWSSGAQKQPSPSPSVCWTDWMWSESDFEDVFWQNHGAHERHRQHWFVQWSLRQRSVPLFYTLH